MKTNVERPVGQYVWMILAVICQCLVALMPVVWVSRTIAKWPGLRGIPGFTPLALSIAALTAAVLLATVIGLALSRSWGWSLALMVNAIMAGYVALGTITAPRPSWWETWELVVAIVAIVALLLPPVRTHYSRWKTPWALSWWAQPLNTGIDNVLIHLVAVTHVLFNTVLLLKALALFPYSGLLFLWPAAGIFVAVKLFRNPKLGRLLTLGWCIFGLIFWITTWNSAMAAARHNRNLSYPQWRGELLVFCGYCGAAGLYLSLSVLKGWLDGMNAGGVRAPAAVDR